MQEFTKKFEITRTFFSNSLGIMETVKMQIGTNNWNVETYRKQLKRRMFYIAALFANISWGSKFYFASFSR